MIDTDFLSPNLVNIGILIIGSGVVGVFLFEGPLSLIAGLAMGIGATPVFTSTRRDSTRSFGAGVACLLWAFTLLADFSTEVMIALGVVGIWFLGTADMDSTRELVFQGTVGANATERKDEQ